MSHPVEAMWFFRLRETGNFEKSDRNRSLGKTDNEKCLFRENTTLIRISRSFAIEVRFRQLFRATHKIYENFEEAFELCFELKSFL